MLCGVSLSTLSKGTGAKQNSEAGAVRHLLESSPRSARKMPQTRSEPIEAPEEKNLTSNFTKTKKNQNSSIQLFSGELNIHFNVTVLHSDNIPRLRPGRSSLWRRKHDGPA